MDNEREMLSIILLLLALVNISNGFLVWDNSAQSKRNSGMPEVCRGRYDAAIFTQLENICEDCYNLYKEPDVHQLCRSECFGSSFFKQCLEALLMVEDEYVNMAEIIGK
ncbi:ion transport peptide [Eurytemora carolleeae]|uniref:ion transport peptide n=1 Tax=Eurytemora carolleeae TaxID=1294199 RepID=UPI000C761311|nr:ion transport peptide [Eurytemora carolleeae]|eukprot:XP_023328149.1 ion transport peptide-like [Eurytemora affinis]